MNIKSCLLSLSLISSSLCADVMVERMQSVVDEVSELRQRYESSVRKNQECLDQVKDQNKVIKKISMDEGLDYKLFEENRKRLLTLEAENKKLRAGTDTKKNSDRLEREVSSLSKENQRLNTSAQILVEKNHSLLAQINKTKRAKEEIPQSNNAALEAKLKNLQSQIDDKDKKLSAFKQEKKALQSKNAKLEKNVPPIKKNNQAVVPKSAVSKDLTGSTASMCLLLKEDNKRLEQALKKSRSQECKPRKVTKTKTVCIDDNPFPKLMKKKDINEEVAVKGEKSVHLHDVTDQPVEEVGTPSSQNKPERVISEKASAYRLKVESAVYNAPDGNVTQVWEEKTSFTSNVTQGKWVKITGHFVDRKWRKSTEEMWVKMKDTIKR